MLTLTIALLLAAQTAPVLASADDCAIVVAIGKAEVAWGAKGPNQPFVIEGPGPDGRLYRQQCDWAALGVGAPKVLEAGKPGPRFAIDKPVYNKARTTAKADLSLVTWSGAGAAPFISIKHCKLNKQGGQWRLLSCAPGPIT